MIRRRLERDLVRDLDAFPAVALLGPRQVGKTTLALELAERAGKPSVYLDLERDSDRAKLGEPESYLSRHRGSLVILDEVQRLPELFPLLRSLIDERLRAGERSGHFLVLGSASPELMRQSSESLAGRIAYRSLAPFTLDEVEASATSADLLDVLWLRGGFPNSFLAASDEASAHWRGEFLATYLERDLAQLAPRVPAEQMRRFWTMLAHGQGNILNSARLAAGLGLSANTVRRYLDVLTDLFLVRQLPAWSGNSRKRLVRSPKVYVRDAGLAHRLAGVPDLETLLGHPLCGYSWEGFVLEQLLVRLSSDWSASYYRTSAQAEIDLVLEGPDRRVLAIEIKRASPGRPGKGFLLGCEEVGARERFVVIPQGERHPLDAETDAVPLREVLGGIEPFARSPG